MTDPTVRRRRHLIDPANPPVHTKRDAIALGEVQKWVMSVLAVTTILHMAFGLVIGAAVIDDSHQDAQIGLLVIAGLFGILGMAAGRAIHKVSILSWWLIPGVLPTLAGVWWIWLR